jgi:hypothetical protein
LGDTGTEVEFAVAVGAGTGKSKEGSCRRIESVRLRRGRRLLVRRSATIRKRELDAQLRDVRKGGTQRWSAVAVVLPLKAPLLIDSRIFARSELHDLGSIANGLAKLASRLGLGSLQKRGAARLASPPIQLCIVAQIGHSVAESAHARSVAARATGWRGQSCGPRGRIEAMIDARSWYGNKPRQSDVGERNVGPYPTRCRDRVLSGLDARRL